MDSDTTPSVSSRVTQNEEGFHEMPPHVEEAPPLEKVEADSSCKLHEYIYLNHLRRIAIYSENGKDSIALAAYLDDNDTKRIILNDVDISLEDFRGYLNSVTKNHEDDLLFVGIHASFLTGLLVLLVAFGLTLIKSDIPNFGSSR